MFPFNFNTSIELNIYNEIYHIRMRIKLVEMLVFLIGLDVIARSII